jgi:hypothetical protein
MGALGALAVLGPLGGATSGLAAPSRNASAGPLAFPATGILDDFNRGSAPYAPLGPNWSGDAGGPYGAGYFRIVNGSVQVIEDGFLYWRAAIFGANQEAYFTYKKVNPVAHQNLLLKRQGITDGGVSAGTSFIDCKYQAETSQIVIWTFAPYPQEWVQRASLDNVVMQPGDQLGARAYSDGTVEAYKNGNLMLSVNVGTGPDPWPSAYITGGGQIGCWWNAESGTFAPPDDAGFDDFGGGTLS